MAEPVQLVSWLLNSIFTFSFEVAILFFLGIDSSANARAKEPPLFLPLEYAVSLQSYALRCHFYNCFSCCNCVHPRGQTPSPF